MSRRTRNCTGLVNPCIQRDVAAQCRRDREASEAYHIDAAGGSRESRARTRGVETVRSASRAGGGPGSGDGQRLQDGAERLLGEGVEDEVHFGPRQRAGEGVRDRHAAHAGGEGGAHAVRGVLEDDAGGGLDVEARGGQEEELGIGLDLSHVVAGHDHVEEVADAVAPQPAGHPPAGAARGDRATEAEGLRVAEQRFHPRQQRLAFTPLRGRRLHLGQNRLAVQRATEESVQVIERVEPPVGPERVLPFVQADRLATALVGGEPRFEDRRLGVDDEAVEVEDDGGDPGRQGARPQPRAAASCAVRALIRS